MQSRGRGGGLCWYHKQMERNLSRDRHCGGLELEHVQDVDIPQPHFCSIAMALSPFTILAYRYSAYVCVALVQQIPTDEKDTRTTLQPTQR